MTSTNLRSATKVETVPTKIALSHCGVLDTAAGVVYCQHNSGFFSICSVAMWNLSEALKACNRWPKRLDFSRAFSAYRTHAQTLAATDLQPIFFQPAGPLSPELPERLPRVNHHGIYRRIDFQRVSPVIQQFFRPSDAALTLQKQLIARHGIDLQRTIAVAYRGTDKSTEIKLAAPQAYLKQARKLLDSNPGFRVLIQTDEGAVRELFCRELGERCFYLPEVPVSGAVDPSDGDEEQRRRQHLDPCEFGVMVVAVWNLLSRAAFIVNHTGNMALWICLWRGHTRGVIQFDDEGGVVNFVDPRFYWRRVRLLTRKAARRLGLALA